MNRTWAADLSYRTWFITCLLGPTQPAKNWEDQVQAVPPGRVRACPAPVGHALPGRVFLAFLGSSRDILILPVNLISQIIINNIPTRCGLDLPSTWRARCLGAGDGYVGGVFLDRLCAHRQARPFCFSSFPETTRRLSFSPPRPALPSPRSIRIPTQRSLSFSSICS